MTVRPDALQAAESGPAKAGARIALLTAEGPIAPPTLIAIMENSGGRWHQLRGNGPSSSCRRSI